MARNNYSYEKRQKELKKQKKKLEKQKKKEERKNGLDQPDSLESENVDDNPNPEVTQEETSPGGE